MGVHALEPAPIGSARIGRRIADALSDNRIVEVVAGPGWGKSTQLRAVARGFGVERVSLDAPVRTLGELSRRLASASEDLWVVDGAEHLLAVPGVAEGFTRALLDTPDRSVLLGTRRHLGTLSGAVADGTVGVLT
ncbi:hypothetical protein, partial [Pseudonocardia pini]|uniref:hypothetical protein n=1 Tax=Pseudonocardia pini TaxID=2758030 RepID=UPI0015F0EBF1